jgi:hypothetical protein
MRRIAPSVVLAAVLTLGGTIAGLGATQAGATIPTPPALVTPSVWTASPVVSPSTTNNSSLVGTTCATSSFCLAVGSETLTASTVPVIEQWNGIAWSVVSNIPVPSGTTNNSLSSVSCAGPTFCMAVGSDGPTASALPLIEQWNGTAWSVVPAVNPTGSTATTLSAVSCLSTTSCMAVGQGVVATNAVLLAESWNGTSWSTLSTPDPTGSTAASFGGVSCVTPTSCTAVGFDTVGANTLTLAEIWNGSTWTVQSTPNPAPGTAASLAAVTCTGSSNCVAVGAFTNGASLNRNLIEVWNGSTWSVATTPDASTTLPDKLAGVACVSATSCTAVGQTGTTPTPTPLALSWNGVAWSLATTPGLGSSTGTALNGAACLTDWACIAVGSATLSANTQPYGLTAAVARTGYRFVASDGGIFSYGAGAPFLGSMGGTPLNKPVVGMAVMPAGDGYDLVASDGGVFSFGSAKFYGSTGSIRLNAPIVGMAVTPDGAGYWLVASDGGIFAYGDAQFYGSTGSIHLNKPIVGMAATPDGKGYYFVAADGGVFSYGDAAFFGSTGSMTLNKPVVGMTVPTSGGYYLVATDGGIFSYPTTGGPPFLGSTGSMTLNKPIVGMAAVAGGYYLSGSDGGVFTYPTTGGPTFYGSTGSIVLNQPIVGITG